MIRASANVNAEQELDRLRRRCVRALRRAAVYLQTQLKITLNKPNTGSRRRRKGGGSFTVYANPSKPGEPPRKRTGFLQQNVLFEVDEANLTARVGPAANAAYGVHLELGTARMAARPWLLATAQKHAPQMAQILEQEVGGG